MKYFAVFALVVLLFAGLPNSLAFESGGPNGTSGAPGQSTCAQSGCHDQFPLNSGPGIVHVMAPSFYLSPESFPACPPDTSAIRVHVVQQGSRRWGLQITSRDSTGAPMGHLEVVDSVLTLKTVDSIGREYITHTTLGTFEGQTDSSGYWWLHWAPQLDQYGKLWLYFAGVAADGDGSPAGDYVWAASLPVGEVIADCGITLFGDVNNSNTVTSADIIFMVNFMFKSGVPPNWGPIQGDFNCDGLCTAGDIIRLVGYLFKGGVPPCDVCTQCCLVTEDSWYCVP